MKKIDKTTKQVCGMTLLGSALSLTIVFIILSLKKRSVSKALLALATVQSAAGAWLLIGRTPSLSLRFSVDTDEEEPEEDNLPVVTELQDIPLDDEATEADFS